MAGLRNVVVIGAGASAVPMIQSLQKRLNGATHQLVVIEKRDYYAHWPCLIRASVTEDGSLEEQGLVPYDRAFDPSVQLVRGDVQTITPSAVVTDQGATIPYDHLVLASGSIWNGALDLPSSRDEAIEHVRGFRRRLEGAKSVVVVGGGAVGVEYVGELRHFMPDKEVTIVHSAAMLSNSTYPEKFRKALYGAVTKLGAQVVLGDKVSPDAVPEDGYVVTESGKRISADIVINATGGRPNTSFVRSFDPSAVSPKGTIQVTPELRVRLASGAQNVWAMGDIIEWPEQKMAFKASMGHAPVVAKNVLAVLKGGKTAAYTGKAEMIMVSLGPKGGRGSVPFLGGTVLGDWVVCKGKAENLFVSATRKGLGYR